MKTPSVSIIILQYNDSQDTIRCLNSVKELDYPNRNVIIVDNASEVKSVNEIRDWIENERDSDSYTKYKILDTNYNSGYSGGNNVGIKYALDPVRSHACAFSASPKDLGEATSNGVKHGADYVFILNPDTTLEKDALTKLVEAAESDPQIGILGPAIDEEKKVIYGGRIHWLHPELSHITNYQLPITNYYVIGAAMLIKREVIEKIGLLDERYFLYFEDADYCERARKAGFGLTIVPEAKVMHVGSASTSSLGAPLLLRYHFRNAHLFNWKNGLLWVKMALPFWSIFIIIKQLTKIVFMPAKRKISRAVLAGVVDFYKGKFGKII